MFRRGKALDLHEDYLSTAKKDKENRAGDANIIHADKADGNWPEVEIRVGSKTPGNCNVAASTPLYQGDQP